MEFKVAKRTADEQTAHRNRLDEIFKAAVGEDRKGRVSPRGMQQLHAARVDIAELIVQLIDDQVNLTDPTPFLVDRKNQSFIDQNLWREHQGTLKVVKRSYGSKPLSSRLTATDYSFSTTHREIAVEVPLEEVASGATTPSMVVDAISEAINRYRIQMVLDGLDAAIPGATADHTGVSGYTLRYSGLTDTNLGKAIDGIRDDGGSPSIFARHIALFPAMRAFTGWSEVAKAEFEQRGQVGAYLGAPIVTLIDRYNKRLGSHVIRADRAWIAGAEKGAILVDADVSFLNWAVVDEKSATFGTGLRLLDGLFVYNPYAYRVIEV